MLRIGLTGGMGAGKSTVARLLVERGAVLIDSDVIAREVVEPGTAGLAALIEAFGSEILAADGGLDRPALARVAFASDAARTRLNSIVHPLVGQRTSELLAAAPPDAIVVQDIPLLVENGLAPLMNLVLIVMADTDIRVRRLTEYRGIDRDDVLARIRAQASDEQRRAVGDVLLQNNRGRAELRPQVQALWDERLVPFEDNLRNRTYARRRGEIVLAEANPQWPVQAQRLIARLGLVCGADALRIDHVGSTAVPELPAKDVIDLQLTVPDLAAADRLRDRLADAGFPRVEHIDHDNAKPTPEDPAGTDISRWEKRLHCNADPGRPANVHVRVDGWPGEQFALAFRDWLRADPAHRDEYLAIKEKAQAKAAGLSREEGIVAYLSVKEPWFDAVYPRIPPWRD